MARAEIYPDPDPCYPAPLLPEEYTVEYNTRLALDNERCACTFPPPAPGETQPEFAERWAYDTQLCSIYQPLPTFVPVILVIPPGSVYPIGRVNGFDWRRGGRIEGTRLDTWRDEARRAGRDVPQRRPRPQGPGREPGRPEIGRPEPGRPEPGRPEPGRPEPGRPAPRPEPGRPGLHPEPARPAPRPEPARPAPRPEPARPAPRPEPARPAPHSEPARPGRPGHIKREFQS